MELDEVQAYLAGEVRWEEISNPARIFLANLLGDKEKAGLSAGRIRDHRTEADQSGPFNRISAMLDALSGENNEWITAEELAASIAIEDVVAKWIASVAKLAGISEQRVIELTVDTWNTFNLDGALPNDFVIDVSFDDDGPVWRTVHPPLTLPVGLPAILAESPVRLSAICGMELRPPDDESLDLAIKVFLADPKTPRNLGIEITEGVGVQVWLDRLVTRRSLALAEPADLLRVFIVEARRLAEMLTPWEHNPGTQS